MKNQPLEIWKLTRRSAVSAAHGRIWTEELRSRSCRTEEEVTELWQKSRDDRRETSDNETENASDLRWEFFKLGPQKSLKKAGFQGQAWVLSFLDSNAHYKFWVQNVPTDRSNTTALVVGEAAGCHNTLL